MLINTYQYLTFNAKILASKPSTIINLNNLNKSMFNKITSMFSRTPEKKKEELKNNPEKGIEVHYDEHRVIGGEPKSDSAKKGMEVVNKAKAFLEKYRAMQGEAKTKYYKDYGELIQKYVGIERDFNQKYMTYSEESEAKGEAYLTAIGKEMKNPIWYDDEQKFGEYDKERQQKDQDKYTEKIALTYKDPMVREKYIKARKEKGNNVVWSEKDNDFIVKYGAPGAASTSSAGGGSGL